MPEFAAKTTVAPEKTRADIESTLHRYGAVQFMSGWDGDHAVIGFNLRNRVIRFSLKLPSKNEKRFTHTDKHAWMRSAADTEKAWEQAVRQRWRALLLCIKAKLESMDSGIETFEEAFMPHIVLPGGHTLAESVLPQVDEAYRTGEIPRLTLALPSPKEEKE